MTVTPLTGPSVRDVNGVFYPYALFMESMVGGLIDFETDIFYMMLVDPNYTPNVNAHKFKSSIAGEINYSGYSPGGTQMAISTISYLWPLRRLPLMPVMFSGHLLTSRRQVRATGSFTIALPKMAPVRMELSL
jgi:hypothetical protein